MLPDDDIHGGTPNNILLWAWGSRDKVDKGASETGVQRDGLNNQWLVVGILTRAI